MIRDVAIVGGGPAGAITAILLARAGLDVLVLERAAAPRWRACGVFTSPAAVIALRRLSLEGLDLAAIARPIPAMRVETHRGTTFRMTYGGTGFLADSAVGLDRPRLDQQLLEAARAAGAGVRLGAQVEGIEFGRASARLRVRGTREPVEARLVVGADGLRSVVARDAGVTRRPMMQPRVGLTFHLSDPFGDEPHDARMTVIDDGYIGLAPVPGGRLNVGIVLGPSWRRELRRTRAADIARDVVERVPRHGQPPLEWRPADAIAGAWPLGHQVARRAGDDWLLVGDAAGFLDPFTGEGIHRAIVSAELGASAVASAISTSSSEPLRAYDRSIRAAFGMKDRVTQVVQAFLGLPPAFEYAARRLASRPHVRETLGLVIGDLLPARRAVDPRYLAELLRP